MANGVSSATASVDNRKALLSNAHSARVILQEDTGLLNGAPHKNSFTSNLLMPDDGGNTNRSAVGEANKIDKRLMPQSPHTFLRHWDANKENKNPK
jgi:hypothetical protein